MKKILSLCFIIVGFLLILTYLKIKTPPKELAKFEVQFLKPKPSAEPFVLGFAGEIILARDVASKINQNQDYRYPFLKVAEETKTADLFFATLEAPLSGKNTPCGIGCMKFVADAKAIEGLTYAGVDIVSLANNHIMDGGEKAFQETIDVLDENHLGYIGAGLSEKGLAKIEIKTAGNQKIGYLAFNEISPQKNTVDFASHSQLIKSYKREVDLLVVSFHWGEEYTAKPSTNQKKLAYQAIDLGADIVIGDHPHWIQGVEFYQGKPIFYSVGNFVFDQMWSLPTRQGIIVFCTFKEKKLSQIQIKPILIENFSQPKLLVGKEKEKIMEEILKNSDPASAKILKSYL